MTLALLALAAAVIGALFWLRRTPRGPVSLITGLVLKASAAAEGRDPTPREVGPRRKRSEAHAALVAVRPGSGLLVDTVAIAGPGGPLSLRTYHLERREPSALLLFLHGGGWVVGSAQASDPIALGLCERTGALVLSLDYRLAPEAPYPAAVEDCLAAWRWIEDRRTAGTLPAVPVFVAGDSAGGNLAAALCIAARDRGLPLPAGQILWYPVTDLSRTDSPSYRLFEKGFLLDRADMEWFISKYVPDIAQRALPLASPLLAPDLSSLPPALLFTAAFDVLRNEGEAYAARLREAGIEVEARRMEGLVHGFASMLRILPAARRSLDEAASFILRVARRALASPSP